VTAGLSGLVVGWLGSDPVDTLLDLLRRLLDHG
jgi:hypothetical protein